MNGLIRSGAVAAWVAVAACDSQVDNEGETDETADASTSAASGASSTQSSSTSASGTVSSSSSGTGAGGGGGEGGEGGGPSEVCEAMLLLELADPALVDAGGDAVWSAGEQAMLNVRMTNPAIEGNFWYPGVLVTANVAGVGPADNTLFGIEGSSTTDIPIFIEAAANVASGTAVTLTFTVTSLNEPCESLDSVTLDLTIE